MPRRDLAAIRTTLLVGLLLASAAGCVAVASPPAGQPTAVPSVAASATAPAPPAETATPLPPAPPAPPTPTDVPTLTPTAPPTAKATEVPPTEEPTALPGPTPDGVCRRLRVPILMYHYISAAPAGANAVRTDLSLPPERFEEQLAYLEANGYTSVSLEDLTRALQQGTPLPDKPVILTFDDGYRDHYTEAFPALARHGFTGTFFVVTGYLDEERPEYLSWEQATEMHEAGMDIASHTFTHPDLRNQTVDYLVWQILGSKEAIEARTGEPVRFFCYPVGLYDAQVIEVLKALNFWGAVVTSQGLDHTNDDLFTLQRVRVHGNYGAWELALALEYLANVSEESTPCTMTP